MPLSIREVCVLAAGVSRIAFSGDGSRAVVGRDDRKVSCLDARTGAQLGGAVEHKASVAACALANDGSVAASVDYDGTLELWSPATGEVFCDSREKSQAAFALAVAPDAGSALFGFDKGAKLLPRSGAPRSVFKARNMAARVTVVAFAPDGASAVLGTADDRAEWVSLPGGEPRCTLGLPRVKKLQGALLAAAFSATGDAVHVAGYGRQVCAFDREGKQLSSWRAPGAELEAATDASLAPAAGLALVVLASGALLLDLTTGAPLGKVADLVGAAKVTAAKLAPDGRALIARDGQGKAALYSVGR